MPCLRCAACGYDAPLFDPRPFRCPHAGDGADHVLRHQPALAPEMLEDFFTDEPSPFVRYRRLMHWWETAIAVGMTDTDAIALVRRLDDAVANVDGRRFVATPLLDNGRLRVKDETANVAGSHKGRHLFGLMLWLQVAEAIDPSIRDAPLAIASCGNAALAAAVIARAARRTLDVFIPADADSAIAARLRESGARVTPCARDGKTAGDPSYARFREAVANGALPFTCQGNENGLVIDGGKTLGWELASQLAAAGARIDGLFIQVGGGALASACIAALEDAWLLGVIPKIPRIFAVQPAAVAPLARAWKLLDGTSIDDAVSNRAKFMWPWEETPRSVAIGIIDDETYDWAAVVRGMRLSGGEPVVVSEERLLEANRIALESTGIAVSVTGSAGLAGLCEHGMPGEETAGVVFTGVRRGAEENVRAPQAPDESHAR